MPFTHSNLHRREFVEEEIRKNMFNIKGEIADIVFDEMIDYYTRQTSKLSNIEKELISIKNSSLSNDLIQRISKQQNLFALNISLMENRIKNLTNIINELAQQKSIQHVKRFIQTNPIGKFDFLRKSFKFCIDLDCNDIFHQQSPNIYEGIFRIKPKFTSQSFEVKCIFENNTGKEKLRE